MSLLPKIVEWLTTQGVPFQQLHHAPTLTSRDSAAARGESLSSGGKALLLSCDGEFRLFVLPADRKLDSAAIRRELPCKKCRFATPDELLERTGLVPGSVPPFGPPVLPFPLYIDTAFDANEKVAFNAGSLTDSLILSREDYLRVAAPTARFAFSLPPQD